jgi:hypothetical protein
MRSIKQIADFFIEKYKSDKPESKYELYSKDCKSTEKPVFGKKYQIIGLNKIKHKNKKFYKQFKIINNKKISKPLIGESGFAVSIELNGLDNKDNKIKIKEICVFVVKDYKIIEENFFYLKSF